MTAKFPRQQDVDSLILAIDSPVKLAMQLGCVATGLIAIITWLALFGLMTAGAIRWAAWPYAAAPIAGWVVLLGLPALWKTRRGALTTLDALATTAEAWLVRAGYSVDLNSDGYIGMIQAPQIEPVQTQVVRPAIYSGPGGVKLLTNESPAIPALADQPAEEQATPPARVLWDLPGNVKLPQQTVKNFVERVFIVGYSRDTWVGPGKPLQREEYDGLMNLLAQSQIIEGRKAGHAGRLTITDPQTALKVLNLV